MINDSKTSELPDSIRLSTDSSPGDIAGLLLNMPLFEDLDTKEAAILSRHFKLYTVQEGAVLFNEGDLGDFMAIVVEGAAEVTKHSEETSSTFKVATAGLGKLVGEMALIDNQPRSASAVFSHQARILVLTRESFKTIVLEYERAGIALLWRLCRTLSQRLRQATGIISENRLK